MQTVINDFANRKGMSSNQQTAKHCILHLEDLMSPFVHNYYNISVTSEIGIKNHNRQIDLQQLKFN